MLAMHQVVAFLLARESIASNVSLNVLHEAFVNQFSSSVASVNEFAGDSAEFGAVLTAATDSLFGMADVLRNAMPDK